MDMKRLQPEDFLMPDHKDEFNPNADEALILKNAEDIKVRINNLMTQIRNLLKRIG